MRAQALAMQSHAAALNMVLELGACQLHCAVWRGRGGGKGQRWECEVRGGGPFPGQDTAVLRKGADRQASTVWDDGAPSRMEEGGIGK